MPVPFYTPDYAVRMMLPMDETPPNSSDEELHSSGEHDMSLDSTVAAAVDGMVPRRNLHPESSRQLLFTWLEANLDHPYPTEEKKLEFIQETGMTMKQINYWFINARRRKVPAMREQQYYKQLAAARVAGNHLAMADDSAAFRMRHDHHMEIGEQHRYAANQASVFAGGPRLATAPGKGAAALPRSLPSPTTHSLRQFSPTLATAVLATGACLPVHSPLQLPQPQPLQHPRAFHLQQQQPHHQVQQPQHFQMHHQHPAQPHHQQQQLQHSSPTTTIWSQQHVTAMVKTPTGAGEWDHLSHPTASSASPPQTLSFEPTSSSGSLASPPRAAGHHPFAAAPGAAAAAASAMSPVAGAGDAGSHNPVALSLRMPVIVQAHLHQIRQTSPQQATMAVQASSFMPWPVRMAAPQVTLAPSYSTNQLVYNPVSTTVASTLPM